MSTKILLVDDDLTLLRFVGEYMLNNGFRVVSASNGAEALRVAYREQPELVVLDVMMPGMDGWEVCARLREMSNIPIILVTGKATEADKLRGFRLGVDDYVTKPFSFAELAARITAVLARSQMRRPEEKDIFIAGNVLLDVAKRQARRGDEVIPLTPTEFRLLECLARQEGKAVAESKLSEEIWGSYRQEDSTAVRRYIWLLRQKIEPDPAKPQYILTVRGFGYRLENSPSAAEAEQ